MFSYELTATHETVIDRQKKKHKIRLLPVRLWGDYECILKSITENPTPEHMVSARRQLIDLVSPFLPKALKALLGCCDYFGMVTVVGQLFTGTNPQTLENVKQTKEHIQNECDWDFCVARMLALYPGYTLETLLDLPTPVFFKLASLTFRVQADRTLFELYPAVAAGQGATGVFEAMQNAHGGFNTTKPKQAFAQLSNEEIAELDKRAEQYLSGNYDVVESIKL